MQMDRLFLNYLRVSCKWQTLYPFTDEQLSVYFLKIRAFSYITIHNYQNQEINIDIDMSSNPQTFFKYFQLSHEYPLQQKQYVHAYFMFLVWIPIYDYTSNLIAMLFQFPLISKTSQPYFFGHGIFEEPFILQNVFQFKLV